MNEEIREYLKNNLRIEIKKEDSYYWSTDGSTQTRFEMLLLLEDEIISSDSYYS